MAERKKKKFNWHEFRVGIFVIGSFAILLLMLFRVTGGRGFFTPKVTAVSYLPNISGLKPGAPVWLNGIEVGNVDSIVLTPVLPDTRANQETLQRIENIKANIKRYESFSEDVQRNIAILQVKFNHARGLKKEKIKRDLLSEEDHLSKVRREIDRLKKELKISRNNLQSIEVIMKIDKGYENYIKQDSEVTIGSIGLLGDKYVDISIGRTDVKPRKTPEGYIFIEGINEATIRQLMVSANDLLANFGDISQRVKSIMAKLDTGEGTIGQLINNKVLHDSLLSTVNDLDATVKKAGVVMADIHQSKGTIGQLLNNREMYDEVNGTVKELRAFVKKLNNSNGTMNKLIQDPQVYNNIKEITVKLDDIIDRINKGKGTLGKLTVDPSVFNEARDSLYRIHQILDQIENGKGTIGLLVKDDRLYENLDDALSEIVKLIYDMRKHPKKYLRIKFQLF